MLNDSSDIKLLFRKEMLDIDTDTEFDQLLNLWDKNVKIRIADLVGEESYIDASNEIPEDLIRSEKLRNAEKEFFNINALELLWNQKAAGAERDVQMPSEFRITLQAFSSEEYMSLIKNHMMNVNRFLEEYIL